MSRLCPIVRVDGQGPRITLDEDAMIMRQVRCEMRDLHVFARGTCHARGAVRA